MKAITKDIARTIKKERKRFLSMAIIAVLGITMFCGLQAGCDDLRVTADKFFDDQDLHDVYIQSTLGLTQEDVDALREAEGVEQVSGFYSEEVRTVVDSVNRSAMIKVLDPGGMDRPALLEGAYPAAANEILVTGKYLNETKKQLGDTLSFTEKDPEDTDEEDTEEEETASENEDDDEFSIDSSEYEIEEEEETPTFANTTYTIVGVVVDPTDINAEEGTTSFRSTASTDYVWFVLPEAADTEIYTGIGLTLTGLKETFCYSDTYDRAVREVTNRIAGTIKGSREQAQTEAIKDEAYGTIADAEQKMQTAFDEAEEKFRDAWNEIEDGRQELDDAQQELDDGLKKGEKEIADGRKKISDGYAELASGEKKLAASEKKLTAGEKELKENEALLASKEKELEAGEAQIEAARAELSAGEEQLNAAMAEITSGEEQIAAGLSQIEAGEAQIAAGRAELDAQEEALAAQRQEFEAGKDYMDPEQAAALDAQLSAGEAQIETARAELDAQAEALASGRAELNAQAETLAAGKAELENQLEALNAGKEELEGQAAAAAAGRAELEAGKAQLAEAKQTLAAGRKQLEDGKAELKQGRKTLDSNLAKLEREEKKMYEEIADGQAKIDDGREELEEGISEYKTNRTKYLNQRADAEAKIADAKQEVEDLESATWYIQNRYSISGYNNVKNDMAAIESLGLVFALFFLLVALLICLTTVTRMVEEDRGLIGTYQALGYFNREIRRKYMAFSLLACFIGCMLGEFFGFIAFPKFLGIFFAVMYTLPSMALSVNWLYFFAGPVLFMGSIGIAVFITCRRTLDQMPAALMRPKAPKVGSRVFLEYIPALWKRISFLNKVTARNLFRYKKRFFMTVVGIAGCMAILICGFGIKDTVVDLTTRQYDEISRYSWMGAVSADDKELLDADLTAEPSVLSYMSLEIETSSLINAAGETMIIPMYIIPEDEAITDYIALEDIETGETPVLSDAGILVTRNASTILGFAAGDTLTIQDLEFYTNDFTVTAIVENYLGNSIFMTRSLFEKTFGGYEENACLAILDESGQVFIDQEAEKEMILSSVSVQDLKDEFSTSFALINMVVYVIIVMAAALAFVVLFTLSTTNISERERELATIKVLGFYDREVHLYVNKETIILTVIGILAGVPLGYLMLMALTNLLKMPELYFAASIHPVTYWISAALSFAFALIVNQLTNRTLNAIDPVEALKSIE